MKKSKQKIKKSTSYVFVLVKSYLLFTLIVLALTVAMIYLHIGIMNYFFQSGHIDGLFESKVKKILNMENYKALNPTWLLGKNGYFEILDGEEKLIYSSHRTQDNDYSKMEVKLMNNYFQGVSYQVETFKTNDENGQIIIQQYDYSKISDENNNGSITGYAILDLSKQFIVDQIGLDPGRGYLTDREFSILQGIDPIDTNQFLYKYQFQTKQGENRTLILHLASIPPENYEKAESRSMIVIPVFISIYIVITIGFIGFMYKKVKNPLSQLNEAILSFTEGKRDHDLSFQGPLEFVQICDSFNVMSNRVRESEEQKRRLMEEKQKMLADISHDLKTPITVIQGYAKAIVDGLVEEKESKKYLQTIYQKSNGLADLIQIFYDYSCLEHPDFAMNLEETNMCEFARVYLARKYDEIIQAECFIEADIPEEDLLMDIDPIQLRRVFDNLIGNTIRHNPKETTIYFRMKVTKTELIVTLGDNGVGIPKAIAKNLFLPFVVGEESRNHHGGSGLGLAIAGKIVAMHQGKMELIEEVAPPLVTEIRITLSINRPA